MPNYSLSVIKHAWYKIKLASKTTKNFLRQYSSNTSLRHVQPFPYTGCSTKKATRMDLQYFKNYFSFSKNFPMPKRRRRSFQSN